MVNHQVCAIIENGVIVRLLVGSRHVCTNIAKESYASGAEVVDVSDYPVDIGFTYVGGRFFNQDGDEVLRKKTEAEEIRTLREDLSKERIENRRTINDLVLSMIDIIEEVDK